MTDKEKIKEILLYGKVLSRSLLCSRFKIEENELDRLYEIFYEMDEA